MKLSKTREKYNSKILIVNANEKYTKSANVNMAYASNVKKVR